MTHPTAESFDTAEPDEHFYAMDFHAYRDVEE